jgi:hypothetical protein
VPTFADRGRHMVSTTDPYGRNLGFLECSRYFFFQLAPQFYSRGWWTLLQTHYFSENLVAPGTEPRSSGSVVRNSAHSQNPLTIGDVHKHFSQSSTVQSPYNAPYFKISLYLMFNFNDPNSITTMLNLHFIFFSSSVQINRSPL